MNEYHVEFVETIENLIDHDAVYANELETVLSLETYIPDDVQGDTDALVNWLEENRPDLLTNKYKNSATVFVERLTDEFKLKIVMAVDQIFPSPPGDPAMTDRQLDDLSSIGFSAVDRLTGMTFSQVNYITTYWIALKEYVNAFAYSFYDIFCDYDMADISSGRFLDGFEESEYFMGAFVKANDLELIN